MPFSAPSVPEHEKNETEHLYLSLWGAEQTARRIDDMYEQQYGNTVIEFCPECSTEVEMRWNVERDGYKAFCPKCGNRLMLCDECQNRDGEIHDDCDYNSLTDSCRFNPRIVENACKDVQTACKERATVDSIHA